MKTATVWRNGYVPIPRTWFPKGFRSPDSVSTREARVDLFMLANFERRGGIDRGCCEASITYLVERWNWSRSKVVRFLKRLEREGLISWEKRPRRKTKVIRILAYDPPTSPGRIAVRSGFQTRHSGTKTAGGFSQNTRYNPAPIPGTAPEPNRTKRVGSPRSERDTRKTRACPKCRETEIAADERACGRCMRLLQLSREIEAFRPTECER